jgi:hypothetical protein
MTNDQKIALLALAGFGLYKYRTDADTFRIKRNEFDDEPMLLENAKAFVGHAWSFCESASPDAYQLYDWSAIPAERLSRLSGRTVLMLLEHTHDE